MDKGREVDGFLGRLVRGLRTEKESREVEEVGVSIVHNDHSSFKVNGAT